METYVTQQRIIESDLFKTFKLSDLILSNRIVMAPMSRTRIKNDVPDNQMVEYYEQRATAGLIIAEATIISPQAKGGNFVPGIFNQAHIEGWRNVTHAVHQKSGHIFSQLWHCGRISHPEFQPNQVSPVAPSAIKPVGHAHTLTGKKPFITPRALKIEEIKSIVNDYIHAARCALEAGFDGIEIHAANGYLLDQFLKSKTNHRTDAYGQTLENRVRLLIEIIEGVSSVWATHRIGVRISPVNLANDIEDANPMETFSYLIDRLNFFGLAYLHCVEGNFESVATHGGLNFNVLRRRFNGIYIANLQFQKMCRT